MADGEANRSSLWTWIGVGCGGLLFLGVAGSCVGPALLGIFWSDGLGSPSFAGGPGPMPPPGTGHSGLILPEAPAPIAPVSTTSGTKVQSARFEFLVTRAEHVTDVAAGDTCPLEVSHIERSPGDFWCRAELHCGGQQLYGGSGQGYFPCVWPANPEDLVVGSDLEQTAADGDPSFMIAGDGTVALQDGEMQLLGTLRRLEPRDDALLAPTGAEP